MWMVTRDVLEQEDVKFESTDMDESLAEYHGIAKTEFKLLDDDGIVYYEGVYYGDWTSEDGFRPLDEFGAHSGCTEIQYKSENGEWVTL